ncbi:cyclophane-forming radical SAM peptide maturase AmcB [Amycolatopsis sp. cg5]|uniref:cyclophane-forming radical SAM peptide maturase AmcB n=1 Tax=Amycolatopsis sp. cg5 TaxID=3238802 RepID=UPI0035269C16
MSVHKRELPFCRPESVIMQPTTLCNLDCRYCYLPFRRRRLEMPLSVARAVATSVEAWTHTQTIEICWHGGEPLAIGMERLGRLMDCFAGLDVAHGIQTNGTLIDDGWCEFFTERQVHVGVSVDGPAADNEQRVTLAGNATFERTLRGIAKLIEHHHEVSIIAVVSDPTPARAHRLLEFAATLGISQLGINLEEQEGVNEVSNARDLEMVIEFWTALTNAWAANPSLRVREINRALTYLGHVLDQHDLTRMPGFIDPLPTIAHDGAVTLISPELAGFSSARLGPFSCGNVLDSPLDELLEHGLRSRWVNEFRDGVSACQASCAYFGFCGGGQPANRHFEHGRFDNTLTNYCRNSKIALLEGVIRSGRDRIA